MLPGDTRTDSAMISLRLAGMECFAPDHPTQAFEIPCYVCNLHHQPWMELIIAIDDLISWLRMRNPDNHGAKHRE
jgi:hypothetical protein